MSDAITFPDMLLIPNRSAYVAGPHMTLEQIAQCRSDWKRHGGATPAPGAPHWTLATCNPTKTGDGQVKRFFTIPRTG